MSIIRVKKVRGFSTMANECLRRTDLSARAKGLWAYLMTLPDDWEIFQEEVHTHFTEGRDAMRTAWKELESTGYAKKRRARDDGGKLAGWEIQVSELADIGITDIGQSNATKDLPVPKTNGSKTSQPPAVREPPALKDPLQRSIDESFRSVQVYENFAKERGQIRNIATRCKRLDPENPEKLASEMLHMFQALRQRDAWWGSQPFIPSALASLWDRIVSQKRALQGDPEEREWWDDFLKQDAG